MSPQTEPAEEKTLKKWMMLDDITRDHDIQIRAAVDPSRIDDYTEIIATCNFMAPMTVFKVQTGDSFAYLLADGFTRDAAYRKLGKDKAPVEIIEGTRSEALEYAITANSRHGAPLSNADKRRACEFAVKDAVLGSRKDPVIAKMLGVSAGFVTTVRRGIKPADRRRQEAPTSAPSKPEVESPAPPSATAHQRKSDKEPETARRPTSAAVLRQVQENLNLEVIEEQQVVDLFKSPTGQYHWMSKAGKPTNLKLVNKSGDILMELPVKILNVNEEIIVLTASVRDVARQTAAE